MTDNIKQHLTPEEVDLWAEGLLATDRTMHLAECGHCLALAEAERRLVLELAQALVHRWDHFRIELDQRALGGRVIG